MKYIFTNILGSFVFDEKFNIIQQIKFNSIEDYYNKKEAEDKLRKKVSPLADLPEKELQRVLEMFSNKNYHAELFQKNITLTKRNLQKSVSDDNLIIQAISNIEELEKTSNLLSKRLREWYSLYLPELSEKVSDHEKFAQLIVEKKKEELLKELNLSSKESMGAELSKIHVDEMRCLAARVLELYNLRLQHEEYLQTIMQKYCPNFLELAGVTIGAKLIELGKGLKHLAMLPASTIQLLGAEKALFRHLKTGSRSPKHGIIVNHIIVQKAKGNEKGKAARMLADKLSLCARLDYFKGEFKAKEYRKALEKTLKTKY